MRYIARDVHANVFDARCGTLSRLSVFCEGPIALHRDAIHDLPNLITLYVDGAMAYRYRSIKHHRTYQVMEFETEAVHDCPKLNTV